MKCFLTFCKHKEKKQICFVKTNIDARGYSVSRSLDQKEKDFTLNNFFHTVTKKCCTNAQTSFRV